MQIFRFPSFRLCPFYPTGINIGSKLPQHVSKHAEKQAETRRVQSSAPQAQQFKNWFESPNAPLSNAV